MKTQVVHGGDLRRGWDGFCATLFDLFENGFVLDLNKHEVVEID